VSYYESELQPWVHYVPVNSNLSDLVDKTKFVLDPGNEERLQNITRNANQWCRNKHTVTQYTIDVLWTLISYIEFLMYDPVNKYDQAQGLSNTPSWLFKWNSLWYKYHWTRAYGNTAFSII